MEVDYAPTEEEQEEQDRPAAAPTFEFVPHEPNLTEDVIEPLIPPIAIGVIAFLVVGLVIWVCQRFSQSAATQNAYTAELNREMANPTPDAAAFGRSVMPGNAALAHPAPPPAVVVAPNIDKALVTGPFLGDAKRKAAKAAIAPIQDLLDLLHKYDSHGLWGSDGQTAASAPTIPVGHETSPDAAPGGAPPVTLSASGNDSDGQTSVTRGATFQGGGAPPKPAANGPVNAIENVERIHFRTEALATQSDLTLPPDQYPAPLRADVKSLAQEVRSYLKDADVAATADSATQAELRRNATQRLKNAETMLQYMNGVIDGTADANQPPVF